VHEVFGAKVHLECSDLAAVPLFVAGYTGRDQAAVRAHIEELQAIGIAPPPECPMYYHLPSDLLTQASDLPEPSAADFTSGEVEPVYVHYHGNSYIGIGSDHTDRQLESEDVKLSKEKCSKPIGDFFIQVPDFDTANIDAWKATTVIDGIPYQEGYFSSLLTPGKVIAGLLPHLDGQDDYVCFGGTIPLLTGKFQSGKVWEMRVKVPFSATLDLTYRLG
jgi:4-hydroxyphenylacetate 3-monooxygenase